ncbi:MICOS complex subunit mic60 [Madurella fahalii]|uniref:MICOS complex subunit MIC60 n=1 Tax=Madurella fahalii TaxID=1157608 RepID=A0ABQ0FWW8_9PEZI
MLRTSLQSVRALGSRPAAAAAGRQWRLSAARRAVVSGQRFYANGKKPADEAKPAVLPASETLTAPSTPPPPPPGTADAAASAIPPENAPLTPPAPGPIVTPETATKIPPPPPPPAPLKKKGFFRRLRNYILTLTLLGVLGFGGGVWYSRINDNFHDFFTEYVPYGEQAVLYLEEMDFKKRFPNVAGRITGRRPDSGEHVKIPAQSGASWRVADGSEPAGRQSSAIQKAAPAKESPKPKSEPATVAEAKKETAALPKVQAREADVQKPVPTPAPTPAPVAVGVADKPSEPEPTPALALVPAKKPFKAPEVDEPSRWPPASPIDPLTVPDAADPVVQDLVRMLNDIITVVNHDGANDKYGATIGKAKNEVSKVGQKIRDMKAAVEHEAADQVKKQVDEFEKMANALVSRLDGVMASQEAQWQAEFEAEMERLRKSYDSKVQLIQERERQLAEEKLNNQLLQQAVELQRQFARDIKKHVEEEREGRLGRLTELSAAVADLEKLTAGWNDVIDSNVRTQQLHVAVEAVRASLEDTNHPRPFIKELVALKEIAASDPVVDAAIASIHPSAYQRGISTPAELMDRFRRVATEVRKASLLPEDAGVASHASSYVLSKVLFKKQGLAAGDDVESILTRTQTFLEEGDLDNAAREMNGLTGWSKTLSRDWLSEVRKVLEVRQALEVIRTEARLQSLRLE